MLDFFGYKKILCSIEGKSSECMGLKRSNRSSGRLAENYVFNAELQDNSLLTNGDKVTDPDGSVYFCVSRRESFMSNRAQLQKTNTTIDIVRITPHLITVGATKTKDYDYEAPLYTSVPAYYEEVTAKMQQWDMGLLAKTTKRFLVSAACSVKLLDRIKVNGENAQIDSVSASQYPGLLWIQTSVDTRSTK